MSALTNALTHPANRPRPLVEWLAGMVNPGADLRGLEDGGGVVCDFRPGLEEKAPSLSVSVGAAGAVFKRFGGDGFEGGAADFTALALNVPLGEAARLLIERAGMVDSGPTPGQRAPWKPTGRAVASLAKAKTALEKVRPLEEGKGRAALRDWAKIEAGEDSPEAHEVQRRGLTPALASGLLTAYRFAGVRRKPPRHILPGALAFEVRGPDGTWWAVKARNPGTKTDLQAVNMQRYVYVTAGQSTPAWCGPGQLEEGRAFLILEGELNAVACVLMLEAAGQGQAWAVQGVASAVAWPHLAHIPAGARVCIWADPDPEGEAARVKWGEVLTAQGAHVFQIEGGAASPFAVSDALGNRQTDADACDALASVPPFSSSEAHAAGCGARLIEALKAAKPWKPEAAKVERQTDGPPTEGQGQAGDVWETKRRGYGVRGGKLCALTLKNEDGEDREQVEVLADFAAFITAEVIEEDGSGDARRVFRIAGTRPDGTPLFPPVVTVTTAEFSGMAWAVAMWGGEARIPAGQGKKDKGRDCIQVVSNALGYPRLTEYRHTGWIVHPEYGPVYLTAGAVIGRAGGVDGVTVELGGRLTAYDLPDPAKLEDGTARPVEDVRRAVRASLALLELAPDGVGVPLLGAAYRAVLGAADFVLWVTGETGRNKTAYMGLIQAHYGARWGRKFLPDGWNSSANALEVNAFRVKDALFGIDDFKPAGGAADRAKMDGTASRIISGAADGAGRGTLTAERKTRAALYPRGLIAASAEDLPRVHSNRARLVIVEVTRPLIGKDKAKSDAFYAGEETAAAGVYALALASFIQKCAGHFGAVRAGGAAHGARVRQLAPHFEGQHGRTGDAAAELAYGWEVFLSFALTVGAVSEGEARAYWQRVTVALAETAQGQAEHLTEADPVDRALSVLSSLLSQGRVFLEDRREGGPVPADVAPMCGYERHTFRGAGGEVEETYRTRPGAVLVGWYSKAGGDEWSHFLPNALHEALQKAISGQGGGTLPDAAKLWANMRDRLAPAGLMKCETEAGGRTRATVKTLKPDGSRQQLLTFRLPLDGGYEKVGTLGTLGTASTLSTASTVSGPVPTFKYFSDELGTLGTFIEEVSSLSPPAVPAAGPLEDLESVPWDDLTGGVLEGEDLPGMVRL